MSKPQNRIDYLDGLRGVAILLVFFYHAYSRWPDIMPYGQLDVPFFVNYGSFGVMLFFMLSGFVILLTLQRCQNWQTFAVKRWLRLFPCMLICSILIFSTTDLLPLRPNGGAEWYDLLPGLLFIEPLIFWQLGIPVNPLEWAFWSIFVEVKFYLFAGFCYFFLPRKWFSYYVLAAYCIWTSLDFAFMSQVPQGSNAHVLWNVFSFEYFGWFAVGCFCFQGYYSDNKTYLGFAFCLAVICAVIHAGPDVPGILSLLSLIIIFHASLIFRPLQKILTTRFLIFTGFVSYPLYLIHENMMVAIVRGLGPLLSDTLCILLPIAVLTFQMALSLIIVKYAEKYLIAFLKQFSFFNARKALENK